ncbi:MAG: enoyl-CoA hydratase/isomerase family protein, partial [Chloroflexota bacterium]
RQAFVAGGDLKELSRHPEAEAGERLNRVMGQALHQLTQLPIPTIAAVNGDAFGGGCEILTACDLRLARRRFHFCFAQAKNGLTTGWGGTGRLVALLGLSTALDLLLTARLFDAAEAHRLGLIHRLVEAETDVVEAAYAWANDLLVLPHSALAALKQLAYQATHLPPDQLRHLEGELFTGLWQSPDHREALAAFNEKRQPHFNEHV